MRVHCLSLTPLQVAASIRINDSLQERSSRFYAEIKRLRQIYELAAGAIGLATTHDLALTAMQGLEGGGLRNVHFDDRIDNGVISFDYKLRDGVVTRSNALELMRSIGLKV